MDEKKDKKEATVEKAPLKEKKEKKTKAPKEKVLKVKESEYNKIIEEAKEYKDKYMRLYAEFDNARKRMDREKQDFVKYANEGIIGEFLDIMDNLERSLSAAEEKHQDYDAFLKGIEMVMANIYELLKRNNVKPIEAKGKIFDPHAHEVLMQEENDELEEGTVLEEFQKGYLLGEKVVRTAKVKVSKKKD